MTKNAVLIHATKTADELRAEIAYFEALYAAAVSRDRQKRYSRAIVARRGALEIVERRERERATRR